MTNRALLLPISLALLAAACHRAHEGAPSAVDARAPVEPPMVRLAEQVRVAVPALLEVPEDALAVPVAPQPPAVPIAGQRLADYEALRPKSVLDLQPWRREVSPEEGVTLIDLHPRHHRWLLLQVGDQTYHLENPAPETLLVDLAASNPSGLALVHLGDHRTIHCAPWKGVPTELEAARADPRAYVPICEHLLLRNPVRGRRSTLEWSAQFVRDHFAGAEHLTELVKRTTGGRFRVQADVEEVRAAAPGAVGPIAVRLLDEHAGASVGRGSLGLPLEETATHLPAGRYHPVREQPGVSVALVSPRMVAQPDDPADRALLGSIDEREADALVVLVALDLGAFELDFEVGTEHPGVAWSPRAPPERTDRALPGPDGIGDLAPLARTGQVSPFLAHRLAGTFVGGFKRDHAAFRSGPLVEGYGASHYGVIQDGVIHSKLQPGLSTLVVWDDGEVDVLTWAAALDAELDRVRHARQNGVPLVERRDGVPRAGTLVGAWRDGNWGGSVHGDLRSLRAAACLQRGPRGPHLIYGYFTAATPRTMARVLLAAGCEDAIHLDMNALEHTYLALYDHGVDGRWTVHHLDTGMAVLDKEQRGVTLPRFVALADNRDFFLLLRREP